MEIRVKKIFPLRLRIGGTLDRDRSFLRTGDEMDVILALVQSRKRPLRVLDVMCHFQRVQAGAFPSQGQFQTIVIPAENQRLQIDRLAPP